MPSGSRNGSQLLGFFSCALESLGSDDLCITRCVYGTRGAQLIGKLGRQTNLEPKRRPQQKFGGCAGDCAPVGSGGKTPGQSPWSWGRVRGQRPLKPTASHWYIFLRLYPTLSWNTRYQSTKATFVPKLTHLGGLRRAASWLSTSRVLT